MVFTVVESLIREGAAGVLIATLEFDECGAL